METLEIPQPVPRTVRGFSLPMRDGNLGDPSAEIGEIAGFSLPMRDGNLGLFGLWSAPISGFSLPMRDGNIDSVGKCHRHDARVLAYL